MIPIAEPDLEGNELRYLPDCIRTGWVSSKRCYVGWFEDSKAAWCGVQHDIAASSGTGALHFALLALGVAPGDEVIVPALTCVASSNAVAYVGACPVFVDTDRDTWNIGLAQVEAKVTPRTQAIIPVHLYGHPVDMDTLMGVADRRGLSVVEGGCEAHGSECKGRRTGGLVHVGCFSFHVSTMIKAAWP